MYQVARIHHQLCLCCSKTTDVLDPFGPSWEREGTAIRFAFELVAGCPDASDPTLRTDGAEQWIQVLQDGKPVWVVYRENDGFIRVNRCF